MWRASNGSRTRIAALYLQWNFHSERTSLATGIVQESKSMMTSSNGNIFRVTCHLCGEFTGHRWIPRTKASDAELWCFLWSASDWVNNREAGDLRCHCGHYDVIVMHYPPAVFRPGFVGRRTMHGPFTNEHACIEKYGSHTEGLSWELIPHSWSPCWVMVRYMEGQQSESVSCAFYFGPQNKLEYH